MPTQESRRLAPSRLTVFVVGRGHTAAWDKRAIAPKATHAKEGVAPRKRPTYVPRIMTVAQVVLALTEFAAG